MTGSAPSSPALKLGRLARRRDPFAPHLSAMLAGASLPPIPANCRWTNGIPFGPGSMGMMLNDKLGDCTCAALGHAEQVWTFNALGSMNTITDAQVEQLYEGACGYQPGNPGSDNGGIEQHVLSFVQNNGIPGAKGKVLGWAEVDCRHHDDVSRVIWDCGVCYLGFNVPAPLMASHDPPAIWDLTGSPADYQLIGGHAIIATGYDVGGLDIVSWGTQYRMTWRFWDTYVDEAYGIASESWVANKASPSGLDVATILSQLSSIHLPGTP